MPKKKNPVDAATWVTVTGLVDDIDAWVKGAFFGFKAEYKAKAMLSGDEGAGLMLILPLVNAEGEEVASQGYSVGSGWVVQEDGARIEHPVRAAIVKSAVYGQLIDQVIKNLKLDMAQYGSPLVAATWDYLGFHWNLKEHKDLQGNVKQGLMPTEWLGEMEAEATGRATELEAPVVKAAATAKATTKAPAKQSV